MNKDNAKDYLPLVQALADGKVIQGYFEIEEVWRDIAEPRFDAPASQYRIKPEPREIWVNEYPFFQHAVHSTESGARNCMRTNGVTRRYREVIE